MSRLAAVAFFSWDNIAGVDEILKLRFDRPYCGIAAFFVVFVEQGPLTASYGQMVADEAQRVLDILRAELQVGMQLLGVRSVDELGPQHVRLDYRAPRD